MTAHSKSRKSTYNPIKLIVSKLRPKSTNVNLNNVINTRSGAESLLGLFTVQNLWNGYLWYDLHQPKSVLVGNLAINIENTIFCDII